MNEDREPTREVRDRVLITGGFRNPTGFGMEEYHSVSLDHETIFTTTNRYECTMFAAELIERLTIANSKRGNDDKESISVAST